MIMIKYFKKISIKVELLFLVLVLINVIKLTGVQWFITKSTYTLSYVLLKNFLFLYFFWRFVLLFKSKAIFIVSYIFQTTYLLVHCGYYLYAGQTLLLPQIIFNFFEGLQAITSVFIILKNPWFYLPFIDIALVLVFVHYYPHFRKKTIMLSRILVPLTLIITIAAFNRLGFFSSKNILHDSFSRRNFKYGTFYAQIYDLGINQQEFIEKIEYGETIEIPPKDKLFNVVTIQVESLNADLIDFKYKGEYITPFLHNSAKNNIYYPYLLAQHKTGNSSDAEFSVFNSIEALTGFPAAQFTEYDYPNSFVKQLKNHSCLSFHGNKGEFYNRYENLEKMGFSRFWDIIRMDIDEIGWGAPDEDVYSFMLDRMKEETNPFYYHIITMTSHGPFHNAKNYYNNKSYNDLKNKSEKNYLNTFSYVDKTIKNFVLNVKSNYPDTYFIIYGDHTVNISGDYYVSDVRRKENDLLFEYVPLIIITPDKIHYRESTKAVSFLDLAPTILTASGEESTIKTFGENLIPNSNLILTKDVYYYEEKFSRQELFNLIKK